ncbi:hypothetical protein [Azospirillum palustre]
MTKSPSWFLYCERIAVAAWTEHERTQESGGKSRGNIITTLSVLEGAMRRLLCGQALTKKQSTKILEWIRPDWYLGREVSKAALSWTGEIKLSDRQIRLAHREVRNQELDPLCYQLNTDTVEALRHRHTEKRSHKGCSNIYDVDVTSSSDQCRVNVTSSSGECQASVSSMSGQCHQQSLQSLATPHSFESLYKKREEKKREEQTSRVVTSSLAQPSASPTLAAAPLAGPSVGFPLMASPLIWGDEVTSVIGGEMEVVMPSARKNEVGDMIARFARRRQSKIEMENELVREVRRGSTPGTAIAPDQLGSGLGCSHPVFDLDPNLHVLKAEKAELPRGDLSAGWHQTIDMARVGIWIGDTVTGVVTINGKEERQFVLGTYEAFSDAMCRPYPEPESRAWRKAIDDYYGGAFRNEMARTKAGHRPVELFQAWSPLYAAGDRHGRRGPCESRMGVLVYWEEAVPVQAVVFNGSQEIVIEICVNKSSNIKAPQFVGDSQCIVPSGSGKVVA